MFQHVPTHGYTTLQPAITGHLVWRNYRAHGGASVLHVMFRNNQRLEKRLCDKLYAKLEKTGPESYKWLKLPFERRPWDLHKFLGGLAGYGAVHDHQVSARRHMWAHAAPTHLRCNKQHPQCNRHHWQLVRQSVASFDVGLVVISTNSCNVALWCTLMVLNTTEIMMSYEERVRSMPTVLRLWHGLRMLRFF
jgi:hypothetical protein